MVTIKRDRYVVFRIYTSVTKLEESFLKSTIWRIYQNIYGLFGSSNAGLYFESFDEKEKTGIIRCTHTSLSQLLTVLAYMTELKETEILVRILNVSGTIGKAKKILSIK